ncbi:MAG: hypothetical protein A2086_16910 [Spirochaetes bacterium GWD1_27_9]|nr:MAG: hypothetical protein A2Z98_18180 [Spirochaetes bacterium GWB1_27_13]OHD27024.1 MAG: hypothetical protein A2Y34_18310 [Spirochaetes bacterium GWC1_27_15]OHD29435.1 MAG: hypothetical protein A2086_16910 [Spirochaetes bacterium GWD1_27_9]
MKSFKEWWDQFYNNISPIKWDLKYKLQNNWFRIHCLPESKRYAENENEYSIILKRYNSISSEILDNEECWLVYSKYKINDNKIISENIPDIDNKSLKYEFELLIDDDEIILFWTTKIIWQENKFNNMLKEISDDNLCHIYFVNIQNGNIFAPYDGGADLIIKDIKEKEKLKLKYSEWLSNHPEGL